MTKNEVDKFDQIDRIARFQSFQAGEYWKAIEGIPKENIGKGEVLLIESIRWVDEKAHTVVVRAHPCKYGDRVNVEYLEDGEMRSRSVYCKNHEFLVDDFLNLFEHEPDADKIRESELAQARAVIDDLQNNLVETQSDPDRMQKIVDAGLAEKSASRDGDNLPARPADLNALGRIATGSVSDAVSSGIDGSTVDQLRVAIDQQRDIAEIKANWIKSRTSEITAAVSRLTPFFEEKAAAALAATQDARTYAETLRKGIETLDLYVGNGVLVETIQEGRNAPADVSLSFVQKRLWMDEELAVFVDVDAKFDFGDHEVFDEALRGNAAFVDQIFPTERCVVAMATNRFVDYGNQAANMVNNQENRRVFLLIRNGGNIHRVYSSIDSHGSTSRLFPSRNEQNDVFRGFDGRNINFDDVEFSRSYARHESLSLHYKRFLILMAGLDHRLHLFGEFYPRDVGNNFVSIEFQEKFCNFIHDDDGSGMLPGEVRPPFPEWLKEKNAQLRSGSRVLCHWRELLNVDTAPSACEVQNYHSWERRSVTRYHPSNPFDVLVAYRDKKDICVKIPVTGETVTYKQRTFDARVNLLAYDDSDYVDDIFAFLVLDSVHPDDLRWYINNRDQRTGHVRYIRLFKRALQEIERDRAEEVVARERLKAAILNSGLASDGSSADGVVEKTVSAWRAARRGLSFPKFDGDRPPSGWDRILDLAKTLAADTATSVNSIETFASERDLTPLRIVLTGRGEFALYAAPKSDERDDRLSPFVWVHRIQFSQSMSERSRSWVVLPESDASEEILREYPGTSEWVGLKSPFVTPDDKLNQFKRAEAGIDQLRELIDGSGAYARLFSIWSRMRSDLSKDRVVSPTLSIPIGLYRDRWGESFFLCVSARYPEQLLYRTAPTEAVRSDFRDFFCRIYQEKALWRGRFDERSEKGEDWHLELMRLGEPITESGYEPFGRRTGRWIDAPPILLDEGSLDATFAAWKAKKIGDGDFLWLPPSVRGDDGGLAIDILFERGSSSSSGEK